MFSFLYGAGAGNGSGGGGGFVPYSPDANAATTANLTATYDNGPDDDGIGATLTLTATGTLTIDTVLTALGNTILVKNQTSSFQNGIYTVTTAGAVGVHAILTRATNFNNSHNIRQFTVIYITAGSQAGENWYETAPPPFNVGSSAITWQEQSLGVTSVTTNTPTSLIISPTTGDVVIDPVQGIATTDSPTFDFLQTSVTPTITAAGTNRATATALTTETNIVTTVTSGTGVVLPTITIGGKAVVINRGASSLKIYAPGSGTLNGIAGTTGVTLTVNQGYTFYYATTNTWDYSTVAAGAVQSVSGNIVDNTDPANPIVTQVQSDWNAGSGLAHILNQPTSFPNDSLLTPVLYVQGSVFPSKSYNNGSSGVGATLTNTGTLAALSVDGNVPSIGDRIGYFPINTGAIDVGVYTVTVVGDASTAWVLTRATDFDTSAKMSATYPLVSVLSGSTYHDTIWLFKTSTDPVIVGTTLLLFSQEGISGGTSTNATLNNSTFNNVTIANGTITDTVNVDIVTVTASIGAGGYTIDPTLGNTFILGVTASCTINIGNTPVDEGSSQSLRIIIESLNPGITVTWGAGFLFNSFCPPLLPDTGQMSLYLFGWQNSWYVDTAPFDARNGSIASASSINLDQTAGGIIFVSGSATINTIISISGIARILSFPAGVTLAHSTNLFLPNDGNDIITQDKDVGVFFGCAQSSVTTCLYYTRADGTSISGVTSATGTANQVLINGDTSTHTGALTFTLPQDINTTSSPTFTFVRQSALDGITAAGTDQSTATALNNAINNITTVTSGTGVKLPVAVKGDSITVYNNGALAAQVYSNGSETINGASGATGINVVVGSATVFSAISNSAWISGSASGLGTMAFQNANAIAVTGGNIDGTAIGVTTQDEGNFTFARQSAATGLTATGTDQSDALALTNSINTITTVASGTGVKLPVAVKGTEVSIYNFGGGNDLQIYSAGSETLNGIPGSFGITLPETQSWIFKATSTSTWVLQSISSMGYQDKNGVQILGGNIDGTIIGNTTPAAGTFTFARQVPTNSITAAGTNQSSATALTTAVNNITTTASGTGVKLPAAIAGDFVTLYNNGVNTLKIYSASTETINGGSGATGISLIAGSNAVFNAISSSAWLSASSASSGVTSITGTSNQVIASASTGAVTLSLPQDISTGSAPTFAGITAVIGGITPLEGYFTFARQLPGNTISAAGTDQSTATALTHAINNITIVASGTGVKLPVIAAGNQVTVYNNGANDLQVYSDNTATINGGSGATGISMAAGTSLAFDAISSSAWLTTTVAGLGTMSTQNANAVAITGGTMEKVVIKDADYMASVSGSYPIDPTNGNFQDITVTGSTTFTMASNPGTGKSQRILFKLNFDSGAGAYAIVWSGINWTNNNTPNITQTASSSSYIELIGIQSTWYANLISTPWLSTAVASGSTINLTEIGTNFILVSGTTTINTITCPTGIEKTLEFEGILTLTNSSTLVLPTGANITTAAGDIAKFIQFEFDSTTTCTSYMRADGTALAGGEVTSATGTANQVLINGDTSTHTGALTFTLPQSIATSSTPTFASVILGTGGALKTDTTSGHTALLQAYDVANSTYRTFGTLTAGAAPSLSIAAPTNGTVAIDGATIGGVTPGAGTFSTVSIAAGSINGTVIGNTSPTLANFTFVRQTTTTGITATGTTRSDSVTLTTPINNITTTASGTGATLPSAVAGNDVIVYNNGANTLKLYGASSDTINGVAGSTGITLAAGSAIELIAVATATWLSSDASNLGTMALQNANAVTISGGNIDNTVIGGSTPTTGTFTFVRESATDAISAAGTTQSDATALTAAINNVTTISSGTGVKLPPAIKGDSVVVYNNGVNVLQIYADGSDTINGGSGAVGRSLGLVSKAEFDCIANGAWLNSLPG